MIAVPGGLVVVLIPSDAVILAWFVVYGLVAVGWLRSRRPTCDVQKGLWLSTWIATTALGAVATLVFTARGSP